MGGFLSEIFVILTLRTYSENIYEYILPKNHYQVRNKFFELETKFRFMLQTFTNDMDISILKVKFFNMWLRFCFRTFWLSKQNLHVVIR